MYTDLLYYVPLVCREDSRYTSFLGGGLFCFHATTPRGSLGGADKSEANTSRALVKGHARTYTGGSTALVGLTISLLSTGLDGYTCGNIEPGYHMIQVNFMTWPPHTSLRLRGILAKRPHEPFSTHRDEDQFFFLALYPTPTPTSTPQHRRDLKTLNYYNYNVEESSVLELARGSWFRAHS